ncbi:hypothetical protein BZG36_02446 [Bifiguratus adelaidae]|uniref:AB hydrolase-1 domain-containing protein n=1 Tax=Bifiguratus adelaidae TaxID=1938954 RepID=A0A261Y3K2_9FUNG|nr:hypothetical protein BZG36_02446 [Bifiguratus adelaidae]
MDRLQPPAHTLPSLAHPAFHQCFLHRPSHGSPQQVGYLECGHPFGTPIFFIGGHGASRFFALFFHEVALKHHTRFIWPERPGYGLSENANVQPHTITEHAEMVGALADHLGIKQFGMLGNSLGGLYALAILHRWPERVLGPVWLIAPWISTKDSKLWLWIRWIPILAIRGIVGASYEIKHCWQLMTKRLKPERLHAQLTRLHINRPPPNYGSVHTRPSYESDSTYASDVTSKQSTEIVSRRASWSFYRPYDKSGLKKSIDVVPERECYCSVRAYSSSRNLWRRRLTHLVYATPRGKGCTNDVLVALERPYPIPFAVESIKLPTIVYWSRKDWIIGENTINWLEEHLDQCIIMTAVHDRWGHGDIMNTFVVSEILEAW